MIVRDLNPSALLRVALGLTPADSSEIYEARERTLERLEHTTRTRGTMPGIERYFSKYGFSKAINSNQR